MVTQLHLALVMAIDAKLLVLDEPTLGLDILMRKQFYDTLLNEYFDEERTILVTTHQVEEIAAPPDGPAVHRPRPHRARRRDGRRAGEVRAGRRSGPSTSPPRARTSRSPSARASAARTCCSAASSRAELERLGEVGVPSVCRPLRRGHPGSTRMNRFLWLVRREVWEHRAIWVAPADRDRLPLRPDPDGPRRTSARSARTHDRSDVRPRRPTSR